MQEVTFAPSVGMACFTLVPEEAEQGVFKTSLTSRVGAYFSFRIILKMLPSIPWKSQKDGLLSKEVTEVGWDGEAHGAKAAGPGAHTSARQACTTARASLDLLLPATWL